MPEAEEATHCERHPDVAVDGNCVRCRKPICRECRAVHGYFCSEACAEASRRSVTDAEVAAREERERELQRARRGARWLVGAAATLFLVLAGIVCWRVLLFPYGKICWNWEPGGAGEEPRILGAGKEHVVLSAGKRLVLLRAKDGTPAGTVELEAPIDSRADVRERADGYLVRGAGTCMRIVPGKGVIFRYAPKNSIDEWITDPSLSRAFAVLAPDPSAWTAAARKAAAAGAGPEAAAQRPKSALVGIDLGTGRELWRKTLKVGFGVAGMAASEDRLYAVYTMVDEKYEITHLLCAQDPVNGKRLWSAELPTRPEWGPGSCGGVLLIELAGELRAFDAEGNELWALDLGGEVDPMLSDGILFLRGAQRTIRIDVATGKPLWESPCTFHTYQGLFVAGERLVAMATVPVAPSPKAEKKQLPPGFDQMDGIMKDLGIDASVLKKAKTMPAMLCLDLKSGEERWRVPKIRGRICTDGDRLVVLADTTMTSLIQAVAGGKGVLLVQQFDIETGERLFSRKADIAAEYPVIAGKRLICQAYERREQVGAMQMATGARSQDYSPPKSLGIVAFRLK